MEEEEKSTADTKHRAASLPLSSCLCLTFHFGF